MRPHRLRVTAFGPFPGTVELDLDEVSGAGPFLLRGATGAGKTSLLDAVGYALFGRVPGARGLKQLRSDHAADGVRTSVELWATVGGRAVHVVRTPDQRRPRARGTGTTTDKATVTVSVARDLAALEAGDCDARWSGVQEANDELARLVGMTHEQFVQVVLLPQGEFARFLRARDEERADVLRALFDTRRFRSAEQALRERRDAARDALAAAGTLVATSAARVAALAGGVEVPAAGLPAWAGRLLGEAETAAAVASARADEAGTAVEAARSAHTASRTLARLLAETSGLAGAEARLLARAPEVDALADELAAADRAAPVVALHELQVQAQGRVRRALERARTSLTALGGDHADGPDVPLGPSGPDAEPGAGTDGGAAATRAAAVAACSGPADALDLPLVRVLAQDAAGRVRAAVDARARLGALRHDVRRWDEQTEDLAARRACLARAEAVQADVRARLDALPARLVGLETVLAAGATVAATLPEVARDVDRWDGLVAAAGRLARQLDEVVGAERADLDARARARDAEESHDAVRRARLTGMSVELARALVPGEPCTVCGATEHPAPARDDAPPVDVEAEEAARDAAARAAAAAVATGAALAHACARRDAAAEGLAATAAPDLVVAEGALLDAGALDALRQDLADRAAAARERLQEVRAAADRAAATAVERDQLREQQAAADALARTAGEEVAGCRAAVGSAEEELDRLLDRLHASLGGRVGTEAPSVVLADLERAAQEQVERATAAADALSALAATVEEERRARDAVEQGAAAAGWAGVQDAVDASRDRAWREGARRDVDRHGREQHTTTSRLAALRQQLAEAGVLLPAVAGDTLVAAVASRARSAVEDEQHLALVLAGAEAACREADGGLAAAVAVRDGLCRAVPLLLDAERGTGPLREQAEAARALADLCAGSNDKGIALSTYVLAAHLEQVVEAANLRLGGMSDGRYALVHVEEGEDRRRRAGLGLAVLDAWTGRQRPAGTLSGGETFLASLALALGLADVVSAEAGGARIDALFVDEGFGTLDPDSLDRAMDVLDQLQEHGRMVGVVSHVGELRQRLPRQVHVVAGRSGSTVQVLTG